MRTRCPVCSTVFRVTSEQLRLKAGKVRCGHCQAIFNAFDQFQPELAESRAEPPLAEAPVAQTGTFHAEPGWSEPEPAVAVAEPLEDLPPEPLRPVEPEPVSFAPFIAPPLNDASPGPSLESREESTLAARQAGLVAARELNDSPAFNRWAAGTLASDGLGDFAGEPAHRAVWPFVVVAVLLLIGLLGQLLYHFRTEVVLRLPDSAALYALAAVDIPLPRNSALVSIETSDLQSDNARGLFVLQATLKNRAGYGQGWPALELSLTDVNDNVVSRRVMFAADYLPPGTTSDTFPANGEVAVKLWIEAKEIGAAGYRLYLFYP